MKKMLIGLAAAALLLSVAVGVVFAQYQLLINGGAEDDLSPEWVVVNGNFTRSMSNGPVNPYAGSWMFDAGPSADYSVLQQDIDVVPYDWFCAGGYVYTASAGPGYDEGQMRVDFFDEGGGHITDFRTGQIINPDVWGYEELCGPIPFNAVTADFSIQGFRGGGFDIHTFYDDLFFEAWDTLMYLDPVEDWNAPGMPHEVCLDIDVDPDVGDLSDIPVVFWAGRDDVTVAVSDIMWTDADGVVCFVYSNDVLGTDEIFAWIDGNEDGEWQEVEPWVGPVLKHWEEDFVPEWGSIALLGSGLMGMAGYATLRLRRRQ